MPYNLPENYQPRLEPKYFDDVLPDAHLWQSDVYRLAGILARRLGVKRIVDLGCGTGGKLLQYANEFEVVGIDYEDNIRTCQDYAWGQWIPVNLQAEIVPAELFQDSIVICADVIEHIPRPENLIETLRNASKTAYNVLVSTPDRDRLQQGTPLGPPANPAHVQEWTLQELESWFYTENLPVIWSGWTVSFDNQPDKVNTSLIILSQLHGDIDMPITFQSAKRWHGTTLPEDQRDFLRVWMTPTPSEAGRDITNSINMIVTQLDRYLPEFGVRLVEEPDTAHIHAGHAGQGSQSPLDVVHFHGLYPTASGSDNYAVNAAVIRNLKSAYIVTAPSEWIADVIRRDMHLNPRIIGWGVDTEDWKPSADVQNYVIWNKARVDNVSNPQVMLDLAAKAHDILFLTTFGQGTPNVRTIGRQPYEVMKQHVRHAAVYLSTNVETFGIGTVEALAAGVPVLAFRQGNTDQLIEHGITGFLAEVGDLDGLYKGLLYCLEHRQRLSVNARKASMQHTWRRVAEQFAAIYQEVVALKADIRPHRIDESSYRSAI